VDDLRRPDGPGRGDRDRPDLVSSAAPGDLVTPVPGRSHGPPGGTRTAAGGPSHGPRGALARVVAMP